MDVEREHYLHFVYLLFDVTPRALGRFVDRKYPGGIYRVVHENRDKLKDLLTLECWKDLENFIEKEYSSFSRFTNDIVNNTVLDKDVLDTLITTLHLTHEDRDVVESCASQSDRNRTVLDLLTKKGCDMGVLTTALKDCHQAKDLVQRIETHSNLQKSGDSPTSKEGETKLKLQKSYRKIIQNLAVTDELVDKLIEHDILKIEDSEEIQALPAISEKNRKLMKKLMTRDENACNVFIQLLEDYPTDKKLAEEIRNVEISEEERKVISIGIQPDFGGKCRLHPLMTLASVMNINCHAYRRDRPETRESLNTIHTHKPFGYTHRRIDEGDEEFYKNKRQNRKFNINIVLNKLKNLYQMVFEMSEVMTEEEFTIGQNTIKEILLSLDEEPVDLFQSLSNSDFEQLEEALRIEHGRRIMIRETKEKDERQNNFNDLSEYIRIEEWRKDDKMLVKTRAIDHVLRKLDENSFVVVTGPPGSGKTFTTRHVALLFQCKGFCIIPVIDPKDIQVLCRKETPTVFVVDDIFGNFIASEQKVESWQQFFCSPFYKRIQNDPMIKIISSCRLHVYRDECVCKIKKYITCECNFGSEEYRLNLEEKKRFVEKYIDKDALNELPPTSEDDFFVLLCTLFQKQRSTNVSVKDYFAKPITFYEECINQLYNHGQGGRLKMCCLALCVLHNNTIKQNMFERRSTEKDRKIYGDLAESLGIDVEPRHVKLRESFQSLVGTFLIDENGMYRTVHDKIFDIIAKVLSPRILDCIIEYGDSKFIHERCVWGSNENTELMVIIPDILLDSYIARCVSDWKIGKVRMVFSNSNFKCSEFRTKLLEHIKEMKDLKTFVNTKDTYVPKTEQGAGSIPMILASYYGYIDVVEFLLTHKANANLVREDGVSPLFFASQEGHLDIVCKLLEIKADVNLSKKDQVSPLYIASEKGHLDIVCKLLDMQADVNLSNQNQASPLYIACQKGHLDIVCKLLDMKADVNLSTKSLASPLNMACLKGHLNIVCKLLEVNADVNQSDKDLESPLYTACQEGHLLIVCKLLEMKADVNLSNKNQVSPLYKACQKGHLDIVCKLLEVKADVNQSNKEQYSPLFIACQKGHLDIVCKLLVAKTDVNQRSIYGSTALTTAVLYNECGIVSLLLTEGAHCNYRLFAKSYIQSFLCFHQTRDLETEKDTIYQDILQRVSEYVKKYLRLKSDPKDYLFEIYAGSSALHLACIMGSQKIIEVLIQHKADLNITKEDGATPLYYACEFGHIDVVELLLDNGATINVSRVDGSCPLDIAKINGHSEIVALLLKNADFRYDIAASNS